MRIRWLGHAAFLILGEKNTVAIDPYGEFPANRPVKFDYPPLAGIEADLVLVTHERIGARSGGGTRRGPNTISCFAVDGVRCCHFGDFGQTGLRPEQREAIGEVDVLFLPIGGGPTIDGPQAAEIVAELEPRVAIPMHYGTAAVDFVEGPERFLEAVSGRVEQVEASEADPQRYLNGDGTTVLVLQAPLA